MEGGPPLQFSARYINAGQTAAPTRASSGGQVVVGVDGDGGPLAEEVLGTPTPVGRRKPWGTEKGRQATQHQTQW